MKDLIGILMMFWIFTIKAQIINDFESGDLSMDSLWTASNESGRGMDFVITAIIFLKLVITINIQILLKVEILIKHQF